MSDSNNKWEHVTTVTDVEPFVINGLDIWDSEWKDTGERIQIKDPLYGKDFTFSVYEIFEGKTTTKFAAGEFSNCVWGVYLMRPDDSF